MGGRENYVSWQKGVARPESLGTYALEGVIRRVGINTSGTILTKSVQLLGLADDIDIIARKFETMAETYIRLKSEARRIGLVINVPKTKYMMAKGSSEESTRTTPRIYIDGGEIEAVE